MDHIFELLLEFFSVHAHSIAFPEIALPAVVRVSTYSITITLSYFFQSDFFLFGIFIVAKSSLLTTYGANSIRSENVFPYINNWCLFLYADNLNIRIIQVLFSPRCLAVLKYVDVWPNHFEPCITNWIYHPTRHPTRGMTSWLSLYPSQISISFFFFKFLTMDRNVFVWM